MGRAGTFDRRERLPARDSALARRAEHLHEDSADHAQPAPRGGAFDESQAVDIELEPGQMSLHDVYMIQAAQSPIPRRRRSGGAALRTVDSVFERDLRPAEGKSGVPVNFAPAAMARARRRPKRAE